MTDRSLPPYAAALLSALVLALVSSVLVLLSASEASAVKPRNDHPKMPRSCVAPADLIPQEPLVCELNRLKEGRPTVLLWGDSHAWQMIPALERAAAGKNVNLIAVVMGGCPPMDNNLRPGEQAPACFKANELALDVTRELVQSSDGHRILLAASWQRYRKAIKTNDRTYTGEMARAMRKATPRLMRTLSRLGAEADMVGQVATVPDKVRPCARSMTPYACNVPRKKALADSVGTKRYLNGLVNKLPGDAELINVNGYFCKAKVCRGKVGSTFTWWDELHISATMSRELSRFLRPTIKKADASRPPEPGGEPGCSLPIPILC